MIRPLISCYEKELVAYAAERAFPILPCNLCGSQPNLERQNMKALIGELEGRYPKVRGSMLSALGRIRATHLMDTELWQELAIGPEDLVSGQTGRHRLQVAG